MVIISDSLIMHKIIMLALCIELTPKQNGRPIWTSTNENSRYLPYLSRVIVLTAISKEIHKLSIMSALMNTARHA